MISAEVRRALRVIGYPDDPSALSVEGLVHWLVQHRQVRFDLAIDERGGWHASGHWPGPDRVLEAEGQSPADALAKVVLEVIAREGSQPMSR